MIRDLNIRRNRAILGNNSIASTLNSACSFYFGANTSGWVGNNYAPEVGTGYLLRNIPSQSSGINQEAVNINALLNNRIVADQTLQDSNALQFHDGNGNDLDYTLSIWVNSNDFTGDQYYLDVRNVTPRSGFLLLLRNVSAGNDILFINQGVDVNGGVKQVFSSRPKSILSNGWNHILISFNAQTKEDEMWVNGVLRTNVSFTNNGYTNKAANTRKVNIGVSVSNTLPGKSIIDEFSAYKNLKANQQIADYLYNSGVGKFYPFN